MLPPKDFREMAEEARTMAAQMKTFDAQTTMLMIAEQYDHLAKVSKRENGRKIVRARQKPHYLQTFLRPVDHGHIAGHE